MSVVTVVTAVPLAEHRANDAGGRASSHELRMNGAPAMERIVQTPSSALSLPARIASANV
jgi:hypothetical protein